MLDTPVHQEGNEGLSLLASEPTNRDDGFFEGSFNGVKSLALDIPNPRQDFLNEEEHDGPLFLALLMGNNTLNDAAQKGANQPQLVPDTLDPRSASQAQVTDRQAIPGLLSSKLMVQELVSSQTEEEDDGPLLLALLMGNNNNNAAAQPAAIQPAPDTLDPRPTLQAQAMPDALSRDCVAELLRSVHEIADILANADDKRVKSHTYDAGQDHYVSPVGRVLAVPSKLALQPGVVQSLVIVKAAQVGAKVVPHQDGCSGFTNPPSCTTFWYALEDATTANGCLAVAPGSHRSRPLTPRCRRDKNGLPEFVELDEPVHATVDGVSTEIPIPQKNDTGDLVFEQLEVKAGTLILMHENLVHTSEANKSSKSRVAFNFGVVEGTHEWLADNYLQPYEGEMEFEQLRAC
ncbi:uncharacterized protein J4E78_010590 [Alternaria triticimaculans]|uniref:uncharacterized protein n=1 Tax=Alternaria triticimaculans TaxID=297637 RepID=UPI0020C2C612|nr:uncharacterized protein J4E78_010590 [Alternaria triticimaculans]KAI4640567.1 hypothetical protein J4E78_010590 [Alternaria triticimaculans]